ncbi:MULTISPECIES: hypothetical protein [Bacillus cereus group]|uniref:DUF1433 domain-containing protein n=1 Tax=Bacillus thuringiensis serovar sooncheon TaxID=180891 RepID=A0A9Q5SJX6_BACTU|nr:MULTISPECIES: hypothetical protein [Bacillus cereus group]OTW67679.1 hypothetical protein BK707_21195 [Bacillus thuringiensis serovar coreanensis]OTX44296.1 hypothetical protein BK724_16490 [Bacillus thuringiensis serovar sooncheon]OTX53459.1 hypothetical protein BK725_14875 [Bacillus thuringiensis serovar guiyangiensis]OTX67780.1 hypothetical protein BK727_15895 [Bacillus thuringiensis serovar roskildiensis]
MKKYAIRLFFTFTLILLGGCTIDQKNTEQQIVEKAEERTIQYFKEKQDLDVVITDYRFGPSDLQGIFISGYIKNDESKTFNITIEYGGDEYTIGSISTSENLHLK